jgi:hypothetical protein
MGKMSHYILVIQQRGEGCDYTIGCGIRYKLINASSYEEAEKYCKEYILESYAPMDDYELARAYLALKPQALPLKEWYGKVRQKGLEEERKEIREQELAELARLKAKYGEK